LAAEPRIAVVVEILAAQAAARAAHAIRICIDRRRRGRASFDAVRPRSDRVFTVECNGARPL
jgi:hypothetical protein